ncbi:hypothetical protein [Sporomusa aerivorans]|uniref:hypothetical protein n=1 Tax=Sporomusa aerivorans TaxID=204936 RepID=UPI00352A8E9A
MKWKDLKNINKFTPIKDVFEKIGLPKFKLGSRPIYYMGNGFLISYSNKMFKVENSNRVEYGVEGEYVLSIYYFSNKHELETFYIMKDEYYSFEGDVLSSDNFEIFDEIKLGITYEQLNNYLRNKQPRMFYQNGETRTLSNGKFCFQNNYVHWGNHIFFFFGKSKNTKLSGFEYIFS